MTYFQNVGSDTEILGENGIRMALLKSGTVIQGQRIDETKISTKEFGIISTVDPISSLFIIKETGSLTDLYWTIQIKDAAGIFTETAPGPSAVGFFIPCHSWVVVMDRWITNDNQYRLMVLFQNTVGWITLPISTTFVPLYRPLLVKVLQRSGCLIHKDKEVLSPPTGWVPFGTFLVISEKDFSDTPYEANIPFLKLRGDNGWIVYHPYFIELVGYATPRLIKKFARVPGYMSLRKMKSDTTKCCICYEKPAGASFVHGDHAHTVACLCCARECQKAKKGCPVCRLSIEKVVLNFTS